MRQAACAFFDGKTYGHERSRCARDATAFASRRHQIDGELLECLGGADASVVSTCTGGRNRARAKNRCGVRTRRTERDRGFRAVRELALRSGQERRRRDYRFWLLWRRMGGLAEREADEGLCHGTKT